MDSRTFDALLKLVKESLTTQDTVMRTLIPAEEELEATLQFLATGRTCEDSKFLAVISVQALGYIIPETCRVIYELLRREYLKVSILNGTN
jgi:hypothetical protein